MSFNRRPVKFPVRGLAAFGTTLLLGLVTAGVPMRAQSSLLGPVCAAPPTPTEDDGWPKAVTDDLGTTAGAKTFTATTLLANDTGTTALVVTSAGPTSSKGGSVVESAPGVYTYLPASAFNGSDVFAYEIADTVGKMSVGIVHIAVNGNVADIIAPDVSITSPAGGTVYGTVAVTADASDNVGVAGVKFFDGAAQIGAEAGGPAFSASWNTRLVADGSHSLTAVARDAAGNTKTSAAVIVTVANNVAVPSVLGLSDANARAAILAANLIVGTVTSAYDASVPAGQVASQTPSGGLALRGSAVSYVLSLGPVPTATVPDVVGKTQAEATALITGAGLTVGAVTNASSAAIPAGSIVSSTPAAGAIVAPGSAVAIVVSTGAPVTPPAADGLVLALGFDEASGTVAIDSSASAKNGAIRQAVRVPGKFGGALKFDGVDDWVTVTDTTASPLDLSTGMTLEAWVNPTVMSGWETVLMKERGIAGEGLLSYALYAHDGAPLSLGKAVPAGYVRLNNATQTSDKAVRGTAKLALNAWTHIATTYDGAVQKFYVNGVLVGTANPIVAPSLNTIVQSNGALRIGGNQSSTGEFFQGLIDEVRVYNRALSAAEIGTDMNTAVVR